MRHFFSQGAEHFVPRVRSIVVRKLLERVALRGFEERPKLVFGDEILGVGDIGLLEHPILVLPHQEIRDVLLKRKFRRFLALGHAQSLAASSRQISA